MTSSCRDSARRHLQPFDSLDGTLLLWECFIEQCPEMDLVAAALEYLAGFYDHHWQPLTAAKYREEAARLRTHLAEVTP